MINRKTFYAKVSIQYLFSFFASVHSTYTIIEKFITSRSIITAEPKIDLGWQCALEMALDLITFTFVGLDTASKHR